MWATLGLDLAKTSFGKVWKSVSCPEEQRATDMAFQKRVTSEENAGDTTICSNVGSMSTFGKLSSHKSGRKQSLGFQFLLPSKQE